jgi:hypothetical protein
LSSLQSQDRAGPSAASWDPCPVRAVAHQPCQKPGFSCGEWFALPSRHYSYKKDLQHSDEGFSCNHNESEIYQYRIGTSDPIYRLAICLHLLDWSGYTIAINGNSPVDIRFANKLWPDRQWICWRASDSIKVRPFSSPQYLSMPAYQKYSSLSIPI